MVPTLKLLYSEEQIRKRAKEIAEEINKEYGDEPIVLVCILRGAVYWACELSKYLKMETKIDFMQASSYEDQTESSGNVKLILDLKESIVDKNVIIVEDIVDTGNTLTTLKKLLEVKHPKTLKVCVMLDKPSRRTVPMTADYVGFTIDNKFVVGFGLDYTDGSGRNFPYIGYVE